jgi:pyruvate/2-oxoglutarate/acetoin dehydrogenase E1 component
MAMTLLGVTYKLVEQFGQGRIGDFPIGGNGQPCVLG